MIWFDPWVDEATDLLRLACGAFFIPHIAAKIVTRAQIESFFKAAGYRPAGVALNLALVVELTVAAALLSGFAVTAAGLLGAVFLTVAALSVWKVSGGRWLWNAGGAEYCLFWTIACLVVALQE